VEERRRQVFSREGSDQEPLPKPTPVWRGCAMKQGILVGRPAPPKETPQTGAEPDSEPPYSRRTHPAAGKSPCILTGPLPRCQEKMAHGIFFSSQNLCGSVRFFTPPNLVQEEIGHERSPCCRAVAAQAARPPRGCPPHPWLRGRPSPGLRRLGPALHPLPPPADPQDLGASEVAAFLEDLARRPDLPAAEVAARATKPTRLPQKAAAKPPNGGPRD
jgi:hypothetical protein